MTQRSYAQWTILIGLFFSDALLAAWGTWAKDPASLNKTLSFALLKTAVFGKQGNLEPAVTEKDIANACKAGVELRAWITHRVGYEEVISPEAGARLGENIATLLKKSCFTSVELDIEPLRTPPPWLVPFLSKVRVKLPKELSLHLAVPTITTVPQTKWPWTTLEANAVLEAVDGFDLMIYDTGHKETESYGKVIADTVAYVAQAPSAKKFVLGFPAYHERTPRHFVRSENLAQVELGLKRLETSAAKTLCHSRVEFAFYAHWTARRDDKAPMDAIESWRKEVCK